ncbi:hypothetical protein Pmani_033032 [Petrolisthes manimaculis]|uniref:Uncharacterized protein n=1 Tax=Petrolisthes manimaculis TaxID=1843537 RepID=A0AAE1TQV2_9EUCA|nr:hypothetical protein Pmani_033032 [Petrolisthes manimaculis]
MLTPHCSTSPTTTRQSSTFLTIKFIHPPSSLTTLQIDSHYSQFDTSTRLKAQSKRVTHWNPNVTTFSH